MWEGLLAGPLPLCLRDSSLAVRSVALDVMATIGDDTLKQQNVRAITVYILDLTIAMPEAVLLILSAYNYGLLLQYHLLFSYAYKSVAYAVVSPRVSICQTESL